jgi:hypothetical protein
LGGSGEIGIDAGGTGATTKTAKDRYGHLRSITYTKLRTAAQVARANRLNEEIYGPEFFGEHIAARPFMEPAFTKNLPTLPTFWANSVTK